MLVSFVQTYGNDRKQLHDIYAKDTKLIEFKNLFDINIFSFNNCDNKTIDYFKKINPVNNSYYINFTYEYTMCIKELLKLLDQFKCTHFFFHQDDTFSYDNTDIDFNEFLRYVKSFKQDFMYNFYYNSTMFNNLKLLHSLSSLNIYENVSTKFSELNLGGMDDTPYIATIDMVKRIYDDGYFKKVNIWSAEKYLIRKYLNEEIKRYVGDKTLFQNYNIIGNNIEHQPYNLMKCSFKEMLKIKNLI